MRSGQANSKMFPKESRPPYLQDDDYFDSFKQEIALQAVMAWGQTMAVQKSNTLKENKAEKTNNMRRNTMVKLVEVKAGQDDATSVFHPQRFMRPPVVAVEKYSVPEGVGREILQCLSRRCRFATRPRAKTDRAPSRSQI